MTEQIEAAKAAGVKYTASPIHMLRDDIRFAKKLIADGCIGEIMKVHTRYRDRSFRSLRSRQLQVQEVK